jgi:two-component system NtrC family sensor kinase
MYRSAGLSDEEIIWRITGQVKGVFEGAYYNQDGIFITAVSRENTSPRFEKFIDFREKPRILEIEYTLYKEPFLRFYVPEMEEGFVNGFFVFSLDLSLFWQSVVSAKPAPDVEVFLTDRSGNILAYSDLRFSELKRIKFRKGLYESEVSGGEVVGVFVTSADKEWTVVVEEPVSSVLAPMADFQKNALIAGSIFMTGVGLIAILVFLRIFKPLENLRNYIVTWEQENISRNITPGDEVTELSQAFENLVRRLEEDRKLYSSLFENTLDGIIVFNVEKRVIDVNKTILEQYRVNKEELIGKKMEELIGEELPFTSLFFSEKKIRLKEEIYCQLRQEVLRIEGNAYILWRLKDVSQEKELRLLLEQTAKLSLAGEIACSVAHQINNPLASIMGYAESIMMTASDGSAREKAQVIFRQAQKCAETVRKLLEVGKPFEGKPGYIKPEEVTIEAIKMLSPKAKRKGVKVEFESSLNGEKIFTFPWQVEQVLINVIDNAIDAVEDGGQVRIALTSERGSLCWRVEDNGRGMSPEEMANVFKPFYTTKKYGTGLGLPLARRFIRNLGGDISIKSKEGRGTIVEIFLNGGRDENTDR